MRNIGTICYATSRGLGHLTRDFYLNGLITDVMVVRHSKVPTNEDWYPGAPSANLSNPKGMEKFCDGKDAMLFFETPFHWPILDYCRNNGIRTYLVTMYECTPRHHPRPHRYLCPSLLDLRYFPDGELVHLPVKYPWKERHRARHYVHNGGYLGVKTSKGGVFREGTTTVIEAMQYVKSPIKLTIRVQEHVPEKHRRMCERDGRIEYKFGTVPYDELYSVGDVAVGAQRWNGCSLPLQEAFAAGMMVINTDRFPMNVWLPEDPLVRPARYIEKSCISGRYLEFDEAHVEPKDLAEMMDHYYDKDINEFSLEGKRFAECNSWEKLKPVWQEVLSR